MTLKYGGYYEKKPNCNTLCQRIMTFVVRNSKFSEQGHGVIAIECPALWEMSDEDFQEIFSVKLNK